MKKLLPLFDKHMLKIGIAFLLVFTALYPKLPSIHIVRTWVYIRLEDFFILAVTIIWFIQLLRRKVQVPFKLSLPIFAYWSAGLLSLAFSIVFFSSQLVNFFPHVAALQYLRRIEYMILFFVAFSSVRSWKDVKDYCVILWLTLVAVVIYGLGQRFYLNLWAQFPDFFKQYSFCFPSFQTGNEEFAKGLPLCLPQGARITSTFGGHYDLSAYLVMVLPVLLAVGISVKKISLKIATLLLFIGSLLLLLFTASRVSFAAYLLGAIMTLIFYKKKWYIIPVILISIILLVSTSESMLNRFLSTVRVSSIVTNSQGQLIGEAPATLPEDLKEKISKNPVVVQEPPPVQNLPKGSGFISLPEQTTPVATNVAVVKKTVSPEEARKLKLANGSLQISTVSGSFLIRKALVYDISFTTRFQGEWPNAWKAFLRNPILGSGYSSITLATDNDYFRALGETGLLGIITFLSIFLIFGIAVKEYTKHVTSPLVKGYIFGIAGGAVGLLANATLIDVFEASKVAENMWMLFGIGAGALFLYQKSEISYRQKLKTILSSNIFIAIYFFFLTIAGFIGNISNYFVADDFTWIRWAASSTTSTILKYFTDSQNFFYRPLDKTIVFFLYTFFELLPQGYHVFTLLLHFLVTFAVYLLAKYLFKKKLLAFFTALLFLFHPAHGENIYWFSTISVTLAAVFIMYSLVSFIQFREKSSKLLYAVSFLLSVLAFLSYEIAVILPLLLLCVDIFINKKAKTLNTWLAYIPFVLLIPLYFLIRIVVHAFTGGGDYAYNLIHLVPNVIGNIWGYLGLFVVGEKFLPFYQLSRTSMKQSWMILTALFIIIIGILFYIVIQHKNKLLHMLKRENSQNVLFGLSFALVSLLPYLALGNIAQRYIYLSSVGLSIAGIILLKSLINLALKNKFHANLLFIVVVLALLVFYLQEQKDMNRQWQKAGEATQNVLATFRLDFESLLPQDNLYFAQVPQKIENAWIFPVGLSDGLWLIYREGTPHIYHLQTVDEAKQKIQTNHTTDNYIFTIDKTGKVNLVDQISQ
jgi:hypothetical protein